MRCTDVVQRYPFREDGLRAERKHSWLCMREADPSEDRRVGIAGAQSTGNFACLFYFHISSYLSTDLYHLSISILCVCTHAFVCTYAHALAWHRKHMEIREQQVRVVSPSTMRIPGIKLFREQAVRLGSSIFTNEPSTSPTPLVSHNVVFP